MRSSKYLRKGRKSIRRSKKSIKRSKKSIKRSKKNRKNRKSLRGGGRDSKCIPKVYPNILIKYANLPPDEKPRVDIILEKVRDLTFSKYSVCKTLNTEQLKVSLKEGLVNLSNLSLTIEKGKKTAMFWDGGWAGTYAPCLKYSIYSDNFKTDSDALKFKISIWATEEQPGFPMRKFNKGWIPMQNGKPKIQLIKAADNASAAHTHRLAVDNAYTLSVYNETQNNSPKKTDGMTTIDEIDENN